MTEGIYYGDSDVGGDFVINTSDGDVELIIDGDFDPNGIEIIGTNQVDIYVRHDFELSGNKEINTKGNADNPVVYVHSDGAVDIAGTSKFVGLIYAPESKVEIGGGGSPRTINIEGSVISETFNPGGNGNVEYNDSVENIDLDLSEGTNVDHITYLHITENKVEVDLS